MQVVYFWLILIGTAIAYSVVGALLMACVVFYIKAGVKAKATIAHYGHLSGFILFARIIFYLLPDIAFPGFGGWAVAGVSLRYIFTTNR